MTCRLGSRQPPGAPDRHRDSERVEPTQENWGRARDLAEDRAVSKIAVILAERDALRAALRPFAEAAAALPDSVQDFEDLTLPDLDEAEHIELPVGEVRAAKRVLNGE